VTTEETTCRELNPAHADRWCYLLFNHLSNVFFDQILTLPLFISAGGPMRESVDVEIRQYAAASGRLKAVSVDKI
jgi:hypothetical protein